MRWPLAGGRAAHGGANLRMQSIERPARPVRAQFIQFTNKTQQAIKRNGRLIGQSANQCDAIHSDACSTRGSAGRSGSARLPLSLTTALVVFGQLHARSFVCRPAPSNAVAIACISRRPLLAAAKSMLVEDGKYYGAACGSAQRTI